MAPFATRLALARTMLTRGAAPPIHVADQLAAASSETRVLHDRMGAVLPVLVPERPWRQRVDNDPSDEVRAYILAATMDCTTVCIHVRRGGPQPSIVKLPLRRVDCIRCAATIRRPPPDESDRCDVCGARGVVAFIPFALRMGPALVMGDACPDCVGVLGIIQEVSA